uniref:Phospholipase A2 n=1 Tax=Romanomermis culicivorax TaxID=13658 RepID=A0A915IB58_ROMCU
MLLPSSFDNESQETAAANSLTPVVDTASYVPCFLANLLDFRQVIQCITGRNPFKFYHYGCHCGFSGGREYLPVDAIDMCCKEHALCYKSCKSRCVDLYFLQSYTVICDEVQGTAYITESSPCPNCAFNCDLTASLCFKENLSTFNKSAAVCYSNPIRGLLQSFNGQPVTMP